MNSVIKHYLLLILLLTTASHAQTILRFKPEINAEASRLGDILIIKEDKHHWSDLSLDSHPTPGFCITKATLLDWMTQRLGHFNATWLGKSEIMVMQSTQSSGALLLEKAQTALVEKLKTHYLRVVVTPLSHIKDSAYALDEFKTDVQLTFPTAKRVCVWLTPANSVRLAVWFNVKAYAKVLVANRDMRYDTLIKNDDFSLKERDIAGLNALPARVLPQSVWLKTSITRNRILLTSQLKEPPLVIHGQHLNVISHNHGITIAMDAIALADGYASEIITVKNPLNQKTFIAKISGIQQAELTL